MLVALSLHRTNLDYSRVSLGQGKCAVQSRPTPATEGSVSHCSESSHRAPTINESCDQQVAKPWWKVKGFVSLTLHLPCHFRRTNFNKQDFKKNWWCTSCSDLLQSFLLLSFVLSPFGKLAFTLLNYCIMQSVCLINGSSAPCFSRIKPSWPRLSKDAGTPWISTASFPSCPSFLSTGLLF